MSSSIRVWVRAYFAAVLLAVEVGCGGTVSPPPPPSISVAVSNTTTTVGAGSTAQFTAIVTNDPSAKGVAWKVSCSATACGSVFANVYRKRYTYDLHRSCGSAGK